MARQLKRLQAAVEVETAPPPTSLLDTIAETPVVSRSHEIEVEFEAKLETFCCGDWQVSRTVRGYGYIQNGKLHLDLPAAINEPIGRGRRITIVCY